jgi:hypothetical protein
VTVGDSAHRFSNQPWPKGDNVKHPIPFNNNRTPNTDWYVYRAFVDSIAAAGSATSSINIRAHADFVLHKISFFADIAGAVQTDSSRVLPLVTLQLTDTGSGKQFFSDTIPVPALMGSGQLPHILPGPRRIAANSTIQFNWYNYSAATTYDIYAVLEGVEVYLKD